jgi:Triose-phosphate Transporter family
LQVQTWTCKKNLCIDGVDLFQRAKHDLSRKLSSRGTGYFTLWFAINALYNIANKQTLQKLPLPWLISSVQLVVGSIYIGLVWALKMRPAPELNKEEFKVRILLYNNFHNLQNLLL